MNRTLVLCLAASATCCGWTACQATELSVSVRQITSGPRHHFFGYIGHVQNVPWNAGGRYIVGLRTEFQDHLPAPGEAADIVLLDATDDYAVTRVDRSLAWNLQQGTMLYWNPDAAETQFFFNDRDPQTGKVFTVLYDVAKRQRIREFRFEQTPFGNSGVSQAGGYFLGLNYGRLARLRKVTGYPDAFDWTVGENAPGDDGIFKVDLTSGDAQLLVSYRQLAGLLEARHSGVADKALFINHTLTSRDGELVYFFARAKFGNRKQRINVPCSIRSDGTGLVMHEIHIGGHPEWDIGHRLIGRDGPRQVIYDVESKQIVDTIGTPELFPNPEGDIALSPDGEWFINGYRKGTQNFYTIFNRETGAFVKTRGFDHQGWTFGALRLDAAPCWNRDSTQVLIPGIANDDERTRQMFLISITARDGGQ